METAKIKRSNLSRLSRSNPSLLRAKMPRNKQNKSKVNKQTVIYRDLKFSKSQQTQRIFKRDESTVISNEERVNYVELKFHKTSDPRHRKCLVRNQRKEPGSVIWPVITGILGVLCLVLITALGVLLANLFSSREEQNREISLIPTPPSTKDDCSCNLSSNHWIGFGNSYYHVFNKSTTWPESQAACVELNAHLLKIDNKEEQVGQNLLLDCCSQTVFDSVCL
uniref:C-type lectin domain-containing protein n=1 Tax=Oryctolagus cuniculus TaxID=9986 RepID=G1U480_RABIT